MKAYLPAFAALIALTSPIVAHGGTVNEPPATLDATVPGTGATALPAPRQITRWEDSGMKPQEAQEWASYGFKPQEAVAWLGAHFAPVVARTWADKGFDPEEARLWLDSARATTTMMAELDHADPSEWKREGFTPADRLAWWEAGFAFEDALLLARSGMRPAEAAWHGHEKLKALRAQHTAAADTAAPGSPAPDPRAVWEAIRPYLKVAALGIIAFIVVLAGFLLRRRSQMQGKRSADRHRGPGRGMKGRHEPRITPEDDSTSAAHALPDDAPAASAPASQKRGERPARRYALVHHATPHCIHCKSTDVRSSRIRPHKFLWIDFTEYFRCRHCGKHFAIVSYTPILLVAGTVVMLLTLVTVGVLHALGGK